jgi:putative transposase
MRRSRFSDEQIIRVLHEHAAGVKSGEVRRPHGILEANFLQIER